MQFASATDVAIAAAAKAGTLTVTEHASRFVGETYIAICDDRGIIEVQPTKADAAARIASITGGR